MRELGLVLPPERMAISRGRRPLKRWRYVGVYGPEVMLCAAEVFVGPLATRFWALALPDGELLSGRSVAGRAGVRFTGDRVRLASARVSADIVLDEAAGPPAVESVAGAGEAGGYTWTRKVAGVPVRGSVSIDGRRRPLNAEAVIDDSAGYHARHTSWRWSAGVGRAAGGEPVAWNLVEGLNDDAEGSERTIWLAGQPIEPPPVRFGGDGLTVTGADGSELVLRPWATLAHRTRLGLLRSDYAQPLGSFSGELPGRIGLGEGYGVTERHDAWW